MSRLKQTGTTYSVMEEELSKYTTCGVLLSWPSLDATPMPGNNGSYVDFDKILDTLFAMLIENVYWDMWNEVDNVDFLNCGLDRWLEYWGHKIKSLSAEAHQQAHAYTRIRNEFPNGKVTGPSYGHLPNFAGSTINWFTGWAQFIQQNQSILDLMSLHFLYLNGNLELSTTTWQDILSTAGINYQGTWNVQEYRNPDQLYPSGAAWNIAQLEQMNAPGLRANWMGGAFSSMIMQPTFSVNHYLGTVTLRTQQAIIPHKSSRSIHAIDRECKGLGYKLS